MTNDGCKLFVVLGILVQRLFVANWSSTLQKFIENSSFVQKTKFQLLSLFLTFAFPCQKLKIKNMPNRTKTVAFYCLPCCHSLVYLTFFKVAASREPASQAGPSVRFAGAHCSTPSMSWFSCKDSEYLM